LSLVQNSIAADGVWRAGERWRLLGEANYGLDANHLEQMAAGVAVDHSDSLSYFFGNRYVRALATDEWTVAADYKLTRKYEMIASESYDFQTGNNILSSITMIRRMPRFNAALTVSYDANNADTSVVFTAWPEGLSDMGFGERPRPSVTRNP
jgi:lipopolysaccharide assembly outer membrane protein LptD (OstA)